MIFNTMFLKDFFGVYQTCGKRPAMAARCALPSNWHAKRPGADSVKLDLAQRKLCLSVVVFGGKRRGMTMLSKAIVGASAILVATVAAAGCAGRSAVGPAAGAAAESSSESSQYLIGPGDSLQIFVWDHADLSASVQVRPDGMISTPLVEDLQAAGKAPTTLARDVERVLSEYVRSPVVTVIVQGFVGDSGQQVRVVGQAASPKTLQYRQGMSVLDVIIEVGGLSEFAAGNRARIVRNVDGRQTEIRVRLDDLVNDGEIDQNVRMLPGDVLIIPESIL